MQQFPEYTVQNAICNGVKQMPWGFENVIQICFLIQMWQRVHATEIGKKIMIQSCPGFLKNNFENVTRCMILNT